MIAEPACPTEPACPNTRDGEHLVEVLSRDGSTLDFAVRRCVFCSRRFSARVLVVEDDALVARGHGYALRRALPGVTLDVVAVTTAEAAAEALAAPGVPFDLVVSDYNLAGAGCGADVLAAVAGRIPFVFVCSDARAADLGVPWFDKPCDPAELRAEFARLILGGAQ